MVLSSEFAPEFGTETFFWDRVKRSSSAAASDLIAAALSEKKIIKNLILKRIFFLQNAISVEKGLRNFLRKKLRKMLRI